MKQTLLIITALMLVVGFSNAQTHEAMEFYDDGKPKSIKTYKVSKDKIELVKEIMWHENGQKGAETTFKDGIRIEWTGWYENGQKFWEGTYKNGERDGKWTRWYENGQKKKEETFKDGIRIEKYRWNEDGTEH